VTRDGINCADHPVISFIAAVNPTMRGSSQLFQSMSQFVDINLVFPIRDQGFAIALDEKSLTCCNSVGSISPATTSPSRDTDAVLHAGLRLLG